MSATPITTTSDARGTFRFHGFPPGHAEVSVRALGFAPSALLVGPGAPARIVMKRLGSVAFTLIDAQTGEAVSGPAEAEVLVRDGGAWRREGEPIALEPGIARRIGEIAPGARVLNVRAPGYLARAGEPFDVASGQTRDLGPLALVRGHRVTGTVVDASTEAPILGASVTVQGEKLHGPKPAPAWTWPVARSADNGAFALDGLPSGELLLVASAEGYADAAAHRQRVLLSDQEDDARAPLLFRLERPGELLVRVVDRMRAPVPGVMIVVATADGTYASGTTESTDTKGEMIFEGLTAGSVTVFSARGRMRMGLARPATIQAGRRTEMIIPETGVLVRGRVLSGGRPVPAVVFLGSVAAPPAWGERAMTYELRDVPPGLTTVAVLRPAEAEDGSFEAGRYTSTVTEFSVPDGLSTFSHDIAVEPYTLGPGERLDNQPVTITGHLLDADTGAPLTLGIWAGQHDRLAAPTDDAGRFEVVLPRGGRWQLMARVPESHEWWFGESVEVVVEAGKIVSAPDPLVVTARRPRRLLLRVTQRVGGGVIPLLATCSPLKGGSEPDASLGGNWGSRASADALGIVSLRVDDPGSTDVVCLVPGLGLVIASGLTPSSDPEPPLVSLELGATGGARVAASLAEGVALREPFTGRGLALGFKAGEFPGALLSAEGSDLILRGLPAGAWGVSFADWRRSSLAISAGEIATILPPP